MATRSTTSIHSLMASGGDTIPKEYHRKVLKKIAQLTKVQIVHVPRVGGPAGKPSLHVRLGLGTDEAGTQTRGGGEATYKPSRHH